MAPVSLCWHVINQIEYWGEKQGFEGWVTNKQKMAFLVTRKSWYGMVPYYSLVYLNTEHTAQFNHPFGQNKQGWVLFPVSPQSENTPKQIWTCGHKHRRIGQKWCAVTHIFMHIVKRNIKMGLSELFWKWRWATKSIYLTIHL